MTIGASSMWQLKNKLQTHETSHEKGSHKGE